MQRLELFVEGIHASRRPFRKRTETSTNTRYVNLGRDYGVGVP